MKTGEPTHQHTPDEERIFRELGLDKTIADTFPASDPPSTIPNPDYDGPVRQLGDELTAA
jgi:hypothetical protein